MSVKFCAKVIARLKAERDACGDVPDPDPARHGAEAAARWVRTLSRAGLARVALRCGYAPGGSVRLPGRGGPARRLYEPLHGPSEDADLIEFYRDLLDDPDGYAIANQPGFATAFLGHLLGVWDQVGAARTA